MLITDYPTWISYHKNLSTQHVLVQDFVYGGSARILSRQNSIIEYPMTWLEVPDIVPMSGNEDLQLKFTTGLMILQNARQDFEDEDAAMQLTYEIAMSYIQRLMEDNEAGNINFDPRSMVMQAKPPFSGDNDFGWHLEYDLIVPGNDCIVAADWADLN